MKDQVSMLNAQERARGALPEAPLAMPTQVLEHQKGGIFERLISVFRPSRQPHGV